MFIKRGQNWSFEVIIALSFFVIIFVSLTSLLVFTDSQELDSLQLSSDVAASRLFASGDTQVHQTAIVINNIVHNDRLENLYTIPYRQLQDDLGITDDFCIIITDANGNILQVQSGQNGLGSTNILVHGTPCAQV